MPLAGMFPLPTYTKAVSGMRVQWFVGPVTAGPCARYLRLMFRFGTAGSATVFLEPTFPSRLPSSPTTPYRHVRNQRRLALACRPALGTSPVPCHAMQCRALVIGKHVTNEVCFLIHVPNPIVWATSSPSGG
jgi:hypothetical protein